MVDIERGSFFSFQMEGSIVYCSNVDGLMNCFGIQWTGGYKLFKQEILEELYCTAVVCMGQSQKFILFILKEPYGNIKALPEM